MWSNAKAVHKEDGGVMPTLEYKISESAQYFVEQSLCRSNRRLRGEELTCLLRQAFPNANETMIGAGLDLYLSQSLTQFQAQLSTHPLYRASSIR